MKKFLILVVLIPIQFGFVSVELTKSIKKKISKEITAVYEIKNFSLDAIHIPENIANELKTIFEDDNLFKIMQADTLIGYAFVDKAPSKTDEFDYLVLFDTNLIITKSKVLVYREDYGAEIGSKRWLKQFIGLNETSSVDYGNNIIPISGATISAESMTYAINNLLQSMAILKKHQII